MSPTQTAPLDRRAAPSQERATRTHDRILAVAAALLAEVGLERISTNLICARAGLTPPALYRYFPNKHAVLCALGERLMEAQNEALQAWMASGLDAPDMAESFAKMLQGQVDATASQPHAEWILRALHASPALVAVRLQSHEAMSAIFEDWSARRFPMIPRIALAFHVRLMVEAGYAVIELCATADPKRLPHWIAEGGAMMAAYQREFLARHGVKR